MEVAEREALRLSIKTGDGAAKRRRLISVEAHPLGHRAVYNVSTGVPIVTQETSLAQVNRSWGAIPL